jgi:hypothetical protein
MQESLPKLPPLEEVMKALDFPSREISKEQQVSYPVKVINCPILSRYLKAVDITGKRNNDGEIHVTRNGVACEMFRHGDKFSQECKITREKCPYYGSCP